MPEIKVDPEFQSIIPPLTDEEFQQLQDNILEAGEVLDPICVWKGIIVDGHNRWRVIQENPTGLRDEEGGRSCHRLRKTAHGAARGS